MPKRSSADTSCLIVLTNIGTLHLLHKTYGTVTTTPEVAAEFAQSLPDWIEVKAATNQPLQHALALQVDKGEASALALAIENTGSTVILDDYKARRLAEKLLLNVTGTLGVIIKAKRNGVIPSIKPYLDKIKTTDFRLSPEIVQQALQLAGE